MSRANAHKEVWLVCAGRAAGRGYRVGDDVTVQPQDGGAISGADYALGFVDLIERGTTTGLTSTWRTESVAARYADHRRRSSGALS